MNRSIHTSLGLLAVLLLPVVASPQEAEGPAITEDLLSGLKLRGIGPASRSGRIADVAMDPNDSSTWYMAVASGNAFKTTNRGTTWEPIFENYPVYSTSTVVVDPTNSNVIWLGTGENNGQRSVPYGNGVWRSRDAGASFEHMGLDESEHIGKIVLDPRDSQTVYVAAQGPLWRAGGDRGLYKTTDGGANWEHVLRISDDTGVSDVVLDPRNADIVYASAWQRRRHTGLQIAGGPEGGIHKSEDGGATWRRLSRGLPSPDRQDIGRIGLAISPHDPDVVYAQIAASDGGYGFYASTDRGESWEKRSDYFVTDPQYYMEIFADPHRPGRLYSMDTYTRVSDDDGRTWRRLNTQWKHVDHHDLEFDPDDPNYLMMSTDGGLYESWDLGEHWKYHANQALTQFYRVGIDNDFPFYRVYGGTQDNATMAGPSRTINVHGILNSDWVDVRGGDGFQARVDPEDPNIVYAQSQYAGIVRFDHRTGERVDIQPQPEPDDPPLKWNWDSPLIISPHNNKRIYFGANRLYRSDDGANTWTPLGEDLTRGIDRSERLVMGRTWSVDAIWRNRATSTYGNMVALDESPLVEGLLYTGMDDGRIQISGDGGLEWRAVDAVTGVPPLTYVADLHASRHRENTVYAVFNNHKQGDFAPYVVRSDDRGVTWEDISGDLPDDQLAWTVVEDPVQEGLLFLGTEFGLFVTLDDGGHWVRLKGGLPTIAIRDLEIQTRGKRSGRGVLRPQLLHPRRLHAATASLGGDPGGRRHGVPGEGPLDVHRGEPARRRREVAARRRLLHGAQSAVRGGGDLPPEGGRAFAEGAAAEAGARAGGGGRTAAVSHLGRAAGRGPGGGSGAFPGHPGFGGGRRPPHRGAEDLRDPPGGVGPEVSRRGGRRARRTARDAGGPTPPNSSGATGTA